LESLIQQLREKAERENISISEIARRTGMKQPSISRIFNGKFSPRLDSLNKIAEALGLKVKLEGK